MLGKTRKTDELSVAIFSDNSMYLVCSHFQELGATSVPDLMKISGDDVRALYETLKEHFEGDKTDGR